MVKKLSNLIPQTLTENFKKNSKDFSRDRCLTLPKIITLVLSMTAQSLKAGIAIKAEEFFSTARSHSILSTVTPDKTAIYRARKKVPWEVFQKLFYDCIGLLYTMWPKDPRFLWKGFSVFAVDGSKFTLPASEELRKAYHPDSGLDKNCLGHYPRCLIVTIYDVLRGIPIARSVTKARGSERDEAKKLIPHIPQQSVLLFDRGYPSYDLILWLTINFKGYFLMRTQTIRALSCVKSFLKMKKNDYQTLLYPTEWFKRHASKELQKSAIPIPIRLIKMKNSDGTVSVFITNILNKDVFTYKSLIELYTKRWEIEVFYRHEKSSIKIQNFHSKSKNGILQELYASVTMIAIGRFLVYKSSILASDSRNTSPQIKNTMVKISKFISFLIAEKVKKGVEVITKILLRIRCILDYKPKTKRKPCPRVSKQPVNRFITNRNSELKRYKSIICKP